MDPNNIETQIFLVLFFGVFQVLGAVFLGWGVRQMIAGESSGVGQVFIGAMFAGVGTLFSAVFMYQINAWGFPVGLLATFFVTLVTMFAPQELLTRFGASVMLVGIGGFAVFVAGMVLMSALRAAQDIWFAVIFGVCWGGVGLGFLLTGLGALWRGKSLRFKQTGPGSYTIEPAEESPTNKLSRRKKD